MRLRQLRDYRTAIEQPPVDLEINTDITTAQESAALIADRFQLTPEQEMQRYPQLEEELQSCIRSCWAFQHSGRLAR